MLCEHTKIIDAEGVRTKQQVRAKVGEHKTV
jgi:hypothetical protein